MKKAKSKIATEKEIGTGKRDCALAEQNFVRLTNSSLKMQAKGVKQKKKSNKHEFPAVPTNCWDGTSM